MTQVATSTEQWNTNNDVRMHYKLVTSCPKDGSKKYTIFMNKNPKSVNSRYDEDGEPVLSSPSGSSVCTSNSSMDYGHCDSNGNWSTPKSITTTATAALSDYEEDFEEIEQPCDCFYSFDQRDTYVPPLSQVGGKARALIETKNAGFQVPNGFVLSVAFFNRWLNEVRSSAEWEAFQNHYTRMIHSNKNQHATDEQGNNAYHDHVIQLNKHCDDIKTYGKQILQVSAHERLILQEAFRTTFGIIEGQETILKQRKLLFAVRSSSPEEDLEGTSYAGGYETILAVSYNRIHEALIDCFLSVFDHRVVQYKLQQRLQQPLALNNNDDIILNPKIALVIQQQIASHMSGVAFTMNISNNCFDEIVVNANYGLGETVVSGQVTPDTFVVDKISNKISERKIATNGKDNIAQYIDHDNHNDDNLVETEGANSCNKKSESCLTDDQVFMIVELAKKVEKYYHNKPMDIEWAIYDNQLYLLQARPITTYVPLFQEMLTDPTDAKANKYLYVDMNNIFQGINDCMSPLGMEIWNFVVNNTKIVYKKKSKRTYYNDDTNASTFFTCHGRHYVNLSLLANTPIIGKPFIENCFLNSHLDNNVKDTIRSLDLYGEYAPKLNNKKNAKESAKNLSQIVYRAAKFILPHAVGSQIRVNASVRRGQKQVKQIFETMKQIENRIDELTFKEILKLIGKDLKTIVPSLFFLSQAIKARKKLERMFKDHPEAKEKLVHIHMGNDSNNPTRMMFDMMYQLACSDEIQQTETAEEFVTNLQAPNKYSKEFLELYNEYIYKYGARSAVKEIDIATSTRPAEDPISFFNQMKAMDVSDKNHFGDKIKERRTQSYIELLSIARGIKKEKSFIKNANLIHDLIGYREYPKYLNICMIHVLRKKVLSLANTFKNQNCMDNVDDIFNLSINEIINAEENIIRNSKPVELRALIQKNIEPIQAVSHVRTWPTIIDSRGKIYTRPVATKDSASKNHSTEINEDGTTTTSYACDPISPGIIRGVVRVLKSPYEKPLRKNEILVTKSADPGWTPIFLNASAVVLEVGGALHHAAIIAREYGVPCVSGFENVYENLKDGQLIEVDGTNGSVRILSESDDDAKNDDIVKNI